MIGIKSHWNVSRFRNEAHLYVHAAQNKSLKWRNFENGFKVYFGLLWRSFFSRVLGINRFAFGTAHENTSINKPEQSI